MFFSIRTVLFRSVTTSIWSAFLSFGEVVLFLDVVDTLAVEEICCRPRIMSASFVRRCSFQDDILGV